ncbi:MAG: hypothetical protein KKC96_00045 [Nanoarchaeota archaeon]|nr:hypothetical protein [Nanoarchaeota archaeon]MBU2459171.1 hypothetical protein [Nanoarchaeota archaeon]
MGRPLKLDSIHQGVRDAAILLRTRYNDLVIPPKSVTYSIWETGCSLDVAKEK